MTQLVAIAVASGDRSYGGDGSDGCDGGDGCDGSEGGDADEGDRLPSRQQQLRTCYVWDLGQESTKIV